MFWSIVLLVIAIIGINMAKGFNDTEKKPTSNAEVAWILFGTILTIPVFVFGYGYVGFFLLTFLGFEITFGQSVLIVFLFRTLINQGE